MSGTLRNLTAGGFTNEGTYTPPNLFAGEQDIITTHLPLAANVAVAALEVLAVNASGNLVKVDPAAADGTQIAVCIAVEAAASVGSVRDIPVYVGGFFNADALVWPAAWDTLAERRAAFARTNINVDTIPPVRA